MTANAGRVDPMARWRKSVVVRGMWLTLVELFGSYRAWCGVHDDVGMGFVADALIPRWSS